MLGWWIRTTQIDQPLTPVPTEISDLVFDSLEDAVQKLVIEEVELVAASEAWTRKEGKNKNGGLNAKGRQSYKGGTLKKPVPKGPASSELLQANARHEEETYGQEKKK